MTGLRTDGWVCHNIWDHSRTVTDLYRARARGDAEEMTCAAQAAEIFKPLAMVGETLLDVGCGSGYFWHSLLRQNVPLEYWGIDQTRQFIEMGRAELAAFGLPAERLQTCRIEDMDGSFDHLLCMNVITNVDNYHRPLERLLQMARKSVLLRESIKDGTQYTYVVDEYLDPNVKLRVHVNAYDRAEITRFIEGYGFSVEEIADRRSEGKAELTIGYPHYWTFLLARRK